MMLEGIGSYAVLGHTGRSSAVYVKRPPRFMDSLEALAPQAARADAPPTRYTVQPGDTLAEIVRQHLRASGATPDNVAVFEGVRTVAQQNGLPNANRIHPGQTLDLSALGVGEAPAAMASPVSPVSPPPSKALVDVQSLPPLPGKSSPAAKTTVETETPVPSTSAAISSSGGGGKQSPVGPLAAFAAQRTALIDVEAQGGPANPIGRDLLAELVPEVRYPSRRGGGVRPDLGMLIDDLLAGKSNASATIRVPAAAGMPWERAVNGPSRVSSGYGERRDPFTRRRDFHAGIDLAAPHGTEIRPLMPGTVSFSGWKSGYGKVIIIQHDDGVETVYGHNSANLVAKGDRVDMDSVIGQVGSTGRSTGPHLHLEVRQNGRPVDPVAYLKNNAPTNGTQVAQRR